MPWIGLDLLEQPLHFAVRTFQHLGEEGAIEEQGARDPDRLVP
jgi:hypothetical protein